MVSAKKLVSATTQLKLTAAEVKKYMSDAILTPKWVKKLRGKEKGHNMLCLKNLKTTIYCVRGGSGGNLYEHKFLL